MVQITVNSIEISFLLPLPVRQQKLVECFPNEIISIFDYIDAILDFENKKTLSNL